VLGGRFGSSGERSEFKVEYGLIQTKLDFRVLGGDLGEFKVDLIFGFISAFHNLLHIFTVSTQLG
jgi:hypothetical protein